MTETLHWYAETSGGVQTGNCTVTENGGALHLTADLPAGTLKHLGEDGVWRLRRGAMGPHDDAALRSAHLLHVAGGAPYEMRTVWALSFRLGTWLVISLIAYQFIWRKR